MAHQPDLLKQCGIPGFVIRDLCITAFNRSITLFNRGITQQEQRFQEIVFFLKRFLRSTLHAAHFSKTCYESEAKCRILCG
ncbi:MAG: hypothetical protein ACOY9J_07635, partial [Pseudomonadota bacterium]